MTTEDYIAAVRARYPAAYVTDRGEPFSARYSILPDHGKPALGTLCQTRELAWEAAYYSLNRIGMQ